MNKKGYVGTRDYLSLSLSLSLSLFLHRPLHESPYLTLKIVNVKVMSGPKLVDSQDSGHLLNCLEGRPPHLHLQLHLAH